MTDRFIRKVAITVDPGENEKGREWSKLAIKFAVEHTGGREANTAVVTIFNLNAESRAFIKKGHHLLIEAGYEDDFGQLFVGDITNVTSTKEGPEWVTVIEAGDGDTAIKKSTVQLSLKSGATPEKILDQVKDAFKGVGIGEGFVDVIKGLSDKTQGLTMSGGAADELDNLLTKNGKSWSIQDGQIQVLDSGGHVKKQALVLSSEDSPSPTMLDGGNYEIKTGLAYQVRPGRIVDADFRDVKGLYVCLKHNASGDTHGNDWTSSMEVRPL